MVIYFFFCKVLTPLKCAANQEQLICGAIDVMHHYFLVSPLPCWPALVHHTLLIVYIFKEVISFIGSLEKFQTSVFNALIKFKEMAKFDICGMRSISIAWKDSVDRSAMSSRPQKYKFVKKRKSLSWSCGLYIGATIQSKCEIY